MTGNRFTVFTVCFYYDPNISVLYLGKCKQTLKGHKTFKEFPLPQMSSIPQILSERDLFHNLVELQTQMKSGTRVLPCFLSTAIKCVQTKLSPLI